jgi:hypothetical protein
VKVKGCYDNSDLKLGRRFLPNRLNLLNITSSHFSSLSRGDETIRVARDDDTSPFIKGQRRHGLIARESGRSACVLIDKLTLLVLF